MTNCGAQLQIARLLSLWTLLTLALGLVGCGAGQSSLTGGPATGPWVPPDPAALGGQLEARVDRVLQAGGAPGAVVGVWTPAGTWTTARGVADLSTGQPTSLADTSYWRSITKSFTVTLVLQLVAEGRLDLDAPVARYVQGVPDGERITLRQLANMTSGLFDYSQDPEITQNLTQTATIQELLDIAFRHPNVFPPGSDYQYSNTNTVLLGQVVETITGRPFAQVLQDRILTPLQLRSTLYPQSLGLPSPWLVGYVQDESGAPISVPLNPTRLGPSGAMAGTLEDLHQWGRALTLGTLLPPELQRQRFVGRPPRGGPEYDLYGLGIGSIQGWWGHTGSGLGYQACVFTEPATGSSVAIMVNANYQQSDLPAHLFAEILAVLGWP